MRKLRTQQKRNSGPGVVGAAVMSSDHVAGKEGGVQRRCTENNLHSPSDASFRKTETNNLGRRKSGPNRENRPLIRESAERRRC